MSRHGRFASLLLTGRLVLAVPVVFAARDGRAQTPRRRTQVTANQFVAEAWRLRGSSWAAPARFAVLQHGASSRQQLFRVGDVVERGVAVASIAAGRPRRPGRRGTRDDPATRSRRRTCLRPASAAAPLAAHHHLSARPLTARAGRSLGRTTPFDRAAARPHDYFASAVLSSCDAHASATCRLGSSLPGMLAQPASMTNCSCWYE